MLLRTKQCADADPIVHSGTDCDCTSISGCENKSASCLGESYPDLFYSDQNFVEDILFDVPRQVIVQNPLWNVRIKRVIEAEVFEGSVVDIQVGAVAKQFVYQYCMTMVIKMTSLLPKSCR